MVWSVKFQKKVNKLRNCKQLSVSFRIYIQNAVIGYVDTDHGHTVKIANNLVVGIVGHTKFSHFNFNPLHSGSTPDDNIIIFVSTGQKFVKKWTHQLTCMLSYRSMICKKRYIIKTLVLYVFRRSTRTSTRDTHQTKCSQCLKPKVFFPVLVHWKWWPCTLWFFSQSWPNILLDWRSEFQPHPECQGHWQQTNCVPTDRHCSHFRCPLLSCPPSWSCCSVLNSIRPIDSNLRPVCLCCSSIRSIFVDPDAHRFVRRSTI